MVVLNWSNCKALTGRTLHCINGTSCHSSCNTVWIVKCTSTFSGTVLYETYVADQINLYRCERSCKGYCNTRCSPTPPSYFPVSPGSSLILPLLKSNEIFREISLNMLKKYSWKKIGFTCDHLELPWVRFFLSPGGVLNFELGTDVRPENSTTTL